MANDASPADWVTEAVEGWDGVEEAGSGTTPLMDGESVAWTRLRIPVDLTWEVRAAATHRTYRVTTITDLTDGTSIIATYLVPGLYLSMWLEELWEPSDDPEIVLSVEVACDRQGS